MKEPIHDTHYFLTNPSFVKWVNDPDKNPNVFWDNWLENYPADEAAFIEAITILKQIDFKKAHVTTKRKEAIFIQILQNRKSRYKGAPNLILKSPLFKGFVAACFLGMVVSLFWFYSSGEQKPLSSAVVELIKITAPPGQRTHLQLPDSTQVVLNAGSTLSYPSQFADSSRTVTLEGEAFFDVYHNPQLSFRVHSGTVATVVHGTQFKVKSQQKEGPIAIALAEGSVSVHALEALSPEVFFKLLPGEKLTVNHDFKASVKSTFEYDKEFGFKDGVLVFKEASIASFVKQMESWYGIEIQVTGTLSDTWALTGSFKNESLENVLSSLKFSKGIRYQINENQVTIDISN